MLRIVIGVAVPVCGRAIEPELEEDASRAGLSDVSVERPGTEETRSAPAAASNGGRRTRSAPSSLVWFDHERLPGRPPVPSDARPKHPLLVLGPLHVRPRGLLPRLEPLVAHKLGQERVLVHSLLRLRTDDDGQEERALGQYQRTSVRSSVGLVPNDLLEMSGEDVEDGDSVRVLDVAEALLDAEHLHRRARRKLFGRERAGVSLAQVPALCQAARHSRRIRRTATR